MKEPNLLLKSALFYAQRKHWRVFPITPRKKSPPLTKHGHQDASTSEKQIRLWWEKWPAANIGIPTGEEFWVLDIDPRHGGEESREALVAQHGRLRDTLRQLTGGGGSQYLYAMPELATITNATEVCGWKGIDVRGVGGYIVVPPSIHPSGRKYDWDGIEPMQEPIHPADPWLVEAILGKNGAPGPAHPMSERIPKGVQHDTLRDLGIRMRRTGAPENVIFTALWEANQNNCEDPDKTPDRMKKMAGWIMKNIVPDADRKHEAPPPPAPPSDDAPPPKRASPKKAPPERAPLVEALTVAQVLDLEVRPPEMLIENLLPRRGVTLLTGPQKSGKTIFSAQAAIALATNHALFDYYALKAPGPVLIIEQDDPAGDASFKDIYTRAKVPRDAPIHFYRKAPVPLGPAFIEWLEGEIVKYQAVLAALDSYTALRPTRQPGGDIVEEERREITLLDELGKRQNCLALVVHHESGRTKANALLDWDARGAGTYGMTMAAESQVSITRYRELVMGATERLVRVRGRHMKDLEMTLRLNGENKLYEHILEGPVAPLYPLILEIRRALETEGIEKFTSKDLETSVGVSRATAFRYLAALRSAGAICRVEKGVYRLTQEAALLLRPVS